MKNPRDRRKRLSSTSSRRSSIPVTSACSNASSCRIYGRAGLSIRAIASEMRRAPSTISRELKRNTVSVRGYMPHTAHRLSVKHRARPRQAKLVTNAELRSYVQGKPAKRWSPQQISHRLIKDFPTTPQMRASTETIYQVIYVHARGELTRELGKQLRRGRIARKPHRQPDARRPRFVDPMNSISNRPAEVDLRKVPGHWAPLYMSTPWGNEEFPEVRRPLRLATCGGCVGVVRRRS